MAKRATPENIVKFRQLYNRYGSYAAVARETGFSASTVRRHLQLNGVSSVDQHTYNQLLDSTHENPLKKAE